MRIRAACPVMPVFPASRSSRPRWPAIAVERALAGAVAVALVVQAPRVAAAAEGISEAAQAAYDRGLAERDAGRYALAAREFASAYAQISDDQRELRAAVLFDLVEAHRGAFAAGGARNGSEHPAAHLCAADRALADFIEAEQERSKKNKKTPDSIKATRLREDIRREFMAAKAKESDLDCAALELPRSAAEPTSTPDAEAPRPERRRPANAKALMIAGGATGGFGLVMLGLMVGGLVRGKNARADGEALVDKMPTLMPEDPTLQEIGRRGHSGNAMAIAGGVLGSLALGAGIALLVVGARAKPSPQVAVFPVMTPRSGGLSLYFRF